MPRDSNGNASTDPVYIATPGTTIRAVQHNTPIADIIQMLTGSLARNGTGGMLADLDMNGFTITNLAGGGLVPADGAVTPAKLDLGAWPSIASASTVDLGAQKYRNLAITGTATINSFGSSGPADNVPYFILFNGTITLKNSANLILPGLSDIFATASDFAVVVHSEADVWRVVLFSPVSGNATRPGTVIMHASSTTPGGYLSCNGAAVSRTTYLALFTAIGTAFGVGNGSTTFNLPDLRGEFVRGWDAGRGVDSGRAFASFQNHLLQDHTHSYQTPNQASDLDRGTQSSAVSIDNLVFSTTGGPNSGSHGVETRPRNIALQFCIKF